MGLRTSSVTKLERSVTSYLTLPVRIMSAPYLPDMSFQNSGLRASSSRGCSGRGGASASSTCRGVRLRSSRFSRPTISRFRSTFGLSLRRTARVTRMVSIPVMSIRSGMGSVTCTWTVPARAAADGIPATSARSSRSVGRRRIFAGRGRGIGRLLVRRSRFLGGILLRSVPGLGLLVVAVEVLIVLVDVPVARIDLHRLAVEVGRLFEVALGLAGDREIVQQAGILGGDLEVLFPSESRLVPQALLGGLHAEVHLLLE